MYGETPGWPAKWPPDYVKDLPVPITPEWMKSIEERLAALERGDAAHPA